MTAVEISASIGRCNTTYVSVHPVIPRKINGVKGYSVTRKGRGSWGWRPFEPDANETVICHRDSRFICFDRDALDALRLQTPQLNYALRTAVSN